MAEAAEDFVESSELSAVHEESEFGNSDDYNEVDQEMWDYPGLFLDD